MLRYINGYFLFPYLERKIERDISSKVKELRSWSKLSFSEQEEMQKKLLLDFLLYCKKEIPYYTEVFKESSFSPEKVLKDLKHIQKLPTLTKEIIKERSLDLQNSKVQRNGVLHVRKTGGSTGQSVYFHYCDQGLDWTSAINLYALELAGKKPHHKDCHICAELEFGDPSLKEKVKHLSQNRSRLMIDSFDDTSLEKYYRFIKSKSPYMLQGHPSSAYFIADYVRRNKKRVKPICKVFEPTGEMFSEKMVQVIEANLGCKVVNRYGNAEFGAIAHSKLSDSYKKLLIFNRAFYVEEVSAAPLIVTNYTNLGFPLIRYDTGDVATVEREEDGFYLKNIQGREHDVVEINQTKYPTHFIMDYLDHKVTNIREFQIILEDDNLPIINIVPEDTDDIERIRSKVSERWPNGLDINFVEFENLDRVGWRQKFRHVIDKRTNFVSSN